MPKLNLEINCRACHRDYGLYVDSEKYAAWINKEAHIQDLLPGLSAGERELLISGTCETCFDDMFGKDESEDHDWEDTDEEDGPDEKTENFMKEMFEYEYDEED